MAGSYKHATTDKGKLRNSHTMSQMVENGGDAYETIEEMYGMIWWLADGDPGRVEEARMHYLDGMSMSPGRQAER